MRARFAIRTNAGQVSEFIDGVAIQMSDFTQFFVELREDWLVSRRNMWDTQGGSTETPWPLYSQTPERLRYVYVKGAMLGMDEAVGDDEVLNWGGPNRLADGVTGRSSEFSWEVSPTSARMVVGIPYASQHDEGSGQAPAWAWPKNIPYNIPQRRLISLRGEFIDLFTKRFRSAVAHEETRIVMTQEQAEAAIQGALLR